MPLIYYRSHDEMEVALWEAEESLDYFKHSLEEQDFNIDAGRAINHPEKKLQWYASRFLLCRIFPQAIQLYRKGKPYLFNGPRISFSHSRRTVAVLLSQKNTGVDIQWIDPKLRIVAPRFTDETEIAKIKSTDDLRALSLIWSVKEAVFKTYGTELPFRDIEIKNFDALSGETMVSVKKKGQNIPHRVASHFPGDLALAYLID